ncbi:hypothetical protein [Paraflavitalea speifideaquila]|uniref:hypothetical protein n=1 Tax=Paraflavitalea speifideaquila TaxID=3076558 RepID=UPI0028EFA6C2|nr:hypothetical protein [Paraflavitalea speifideiaquila]
MLELGAKTSDIQELEQLFFNPIQGLVNARKKIDNNLFQITDKMICFFIKRAINDEVISSAFKKVKEGEPLLYGITLVEDTFSNRELVLGFLTFYSSLELSEKIPVHFQFVPQALRSSFKKYKPLFSLWTNSLCMQITMMFFTPRFAKTFPIRIMIGN